MDYAYVGGRPLGYESGAGWDDTNRTGQWQWLAPSANGPGATGAGASSLFGGGGLQAGESGSAMKYVIQQLLEQLALQNSLGGR
jgi:hypothetical protein